MSEHISPQHKSYEWGDTNFTRPPIIRRGEGALEETQKTVEAIPRQLVSHPNVAAEMITTAGRLRNDLDARGRPHSRGSIRGTDKYSLWGQMEAGTVVDVNQELLRDSEEERRTTDALGELAARMVELTDPNVARSRKEKRQAREAAANIADDEKYLKGRLSVLSEKGDDGIDTESIEQREIARDNLADRFLYAERHDGQKNIDVLHEQAKKDAERAGVDIKTDE